MCLGKQEQRDIVEDCLQKLASLMVTFRTYGGKQTDVNRGDFDIDFFRGLNDTCSKIHDNLLSLLDSASQNNEKSAQIERDEKILAAKAVEAPTLEL